MAEPVSGDPPIRVLYLSHQRAEERALLEACDGIHLEELQVHLRRDLGPALLPRLWRSASRLRRFRPDVVLLETPGVYAVPSIRLGGLGGVPLAIRYKGDLFAGSAGECRHLAPGERLARAANLAAGARLLRAAAAVLPVSPALRRSLATRVGPGTAIDEVPLAMPAPRREAAPVRHPRPYLLSVTNFHYWEKVSPLLEAIPAVHASLRRFGLDWLVLGDGVFLERGRAIAAPYADRVHLLGWREAAAHYAGDARAVLHLSRLDGLPNVLLEAWARDLPVVLNRDSPVAELVDERAALLVDLADRAGLDRDLGRLLADDGWRRDLGRRGGAWARERFALERVAAQLRDALARAIGRGRDRAGAS